jgi:uncharacterized protein
MITTVIGVDLSGPGSPGNTVLTRFKANGRALEYLGQGSDGSDETILNVVCQAGDAGEVVVGLDAPLSYEPGGGQRGRDAALRRALIASGLRPGSVMAPTFRRMAWLTLRGMGVARLLEGIAASFSVKIVEVHPGGSFALAGGPIRAVRTFARDLSEAAKLYRWLRSETAITGLPTTASPSSHFLASCGAALAAWKWNENRTNWLAQAERPWHPYDFAC